MASGSVGVALFFLFSALIFFSAQIAARRVTNVLDHGAAPGGKDATEAFRGAWSEACGSPEDASFYVPPGEFLLAGHQAFRGPCNNKGMEFRLEGSLVAADDYYSGDGGEEDHWIQFEYVDGLSISGGGTIDGRGATLWRCKSAGSLCPSGQMSLTISRSNHVQVRDLRFVNSKFFHIFVSFSTDVLLHNLDIAAPGDSPNTDGIHVQNSDGVRITQATIGTGDDCISIGPGTANLVADGITCGPGHGISIGSLGRSEEEAGVRNILVSNAVFRGTQNGLRIKTWSRPSNGFVDGVSFRNAAMQDARNPIIIDQNYCPNEDCCPDSGRSGVKISNVEYGGIHGTSASPVAVSFDCSPVEPCSGIDLQDVRLTYQDQEARSFCSHAAGTTSGFISPPSCMPA